MEGRWVWLRETRKSRDWKRKTEVEKLPYWSRDSLDTKWLTASQVYIDTLMAESSLASDSSVKQVNDVLDLLGTGVHCNTFSEGGKRQNLELQRFKEAICTQENLEIFQCFCEEIVSAISSCILGPSRSVDAIREKSYRSFYQKRISDLPKL